MICNVVVYDLVIVVVLVLFHLKLPFWITGHSRAEMAWFCNADCIICCYW